MSRIWIAVAMVSLLTLAGIAQPEVVVFDQTGQTVTVPHPLETIASVYGIGTYLAYALGGGDRLIVAYYIGVKTLSSASESMLRWEPRLSDILSFGDPNVEELVASGAQLVLADGSQHQAVAEQLRELGIPVFLYQAETAQALKEAVTLTGQLLGSESEGLALALNADYDRIVDAVEADVSALEDEERVSVLFLGTSLTKTISGAMYQSYLIEVAGGISVTRDLPGFWNEVNLEQILLWNPDVILIPPYGPIQPADILNNVDWQSLDAVQSGRVHRMPRVIAPMDTPVPESVLGIAWMAKTLYPDLVTLDLEEEVTHFYTDYYQFALTDEEISRLTSP